MRREVAYAGLRRRLDQLTSGLVVDAAGEGEGRSLAGWWMRLLRSRPRKCCWQGASRWVIQGGGDANPVEHAEDGKVDDIARHAPGSISFAM